MKDPVENERAALQARYCDIQRRLLAKYGPSLEEAREYPSRHAKLVRAYQRDLAEKTKHIVDLLAALPPGPLEVPPTGGYVDKSGD